MKRYPVPLAPPLSDLLNGSSTLPTVLLVNPPADELAAGGRLMREVNDPFYANGTQWFHRQIGAHRAWETTSGVCTNTTELDKVINNYLYIRR